MIRNSKSIFSFGALCLAAGVLILAVPRTAHAVAAALVQVTNAAASPANTEDTSRQASQLVHLSFNPNNSFPDNCVQILPNGVREPFTVPQGQNLVITAVDFNLNESVSLVSVGLTGQQVFWSVPGMGTTHLAYPSGIVIPSATYPNLVASVIGSASTVDMFGYFTTN
jgi:hypothetical protein